MRTSKFMSPELVAQEASREAMLMTADYLDTVLREMRQKELILSYVLEVRPYNSGYTINVDAKFDWNKLYEDSKKHEEMIKILAFISGLRLYCQPSTFFNSRWDEGEAKIESTLLHKMDGTTRLEEIVQNEQQVIQTVTQVRDTNISWLSQIFNKVRSC